jgi:hypothetical protein
MKSKRLFNRINEDLPLSSWVLKSIEREKENDR